MWCLKRRSLVVDAEEPGLAGETGLRLRRRLVYQRIGHAEGTDNCTVLHGGRCREERGTTMKTLSAVLFICAITLAMPVLHSQETYGQPEAPLVAEVLGMDIRTSDAEEMKYVILGRLLDQYAAAQEIKVSQADIDAYLDAMQRMAEQDRERRSERREELQRMLADVKPDDDGYKALSEELEMLDQLAASLDEAANDTGEDREARVQVASAFIKQWKINRALHRQYGGRVIFQQGGPEPLDAYREFLEEQQEKGAFSIADKTLEDEFWKYYRTDSLHTFYPAGSPEEARAFETPWWLLDSPPDAR
jgi:hypothetical protein